MYINSRRIFQVIPNSGTIPSGIKSAIWKKNLYLPLVQSGHDVVLADFEYDDFFVHAENHLWLKKKSPVFSEYIERLFKAEHSKKPFDLCFLYVCDGFIDLNVIKRMQQSGVPVLNYSCNNIHQFHLVKAISDVVDYAVYTEKHAATYFDKVKAKAVHMQMAANPDVYKRFPIPFTYDLSFAGQRYADRGQWITSLIKQGINAKVFGPRWDSNSPGVGNTSMADKMDKIITIAKREGVPASLQFVFSKLLSKQQDKEENAILEGHYGPILSDDEMILLFSETKINLGFSNVYMNGRDKSKTLSHLRLRDFEIPMCGAFYMTGYTDELSDYFEMGKEIEVYQSLEELMDKCTYYLQNESKRVAIANNALTRSLQCHTWEIRYQMLFDKIL